MLYKDENDYLYLVWQDVVKQRQYIVGRLSKKKQYEFCYSNEIDEALNAGFKLLAAFQDKDKIYYSDSLFLSFASRLPDKKRKDIQQILCKYGLKEYDAYALLKTSGARLPIDNLKFIDPFSDIEPEETEISTNLSDSCEKLEPEQNQEILSKIQDMFSDDKGWNSEDDMIKDLADFRKSRNVLRLYPYIKNKTMSHGKAAEILGITKYELILLYDNMGLPYLSMDIAEVEEEVLNWQAKKDKIESE